jgi:hypothetical protein
VNHIVGFEKRHHRKQRAHATDRVAEREPIREMKFANHGERFFGAYWRHGNGTRAKNIRRRLALLMMDAHLNACADVVRIGEFRDRAKAFTYSNDASPRGAWATNGCKVPPILVFGVALKG